MYQNDEDQLFKAVEHGELGQVKNIIDSKQVDISALNRHEPNIVNFLLNMPTTKEKDKKLRILISAGALPTIDQNNNFLMQLVLVIKDIAIRNEILTTVAQTYPIFNEYYPESHVQAIHGVKPGKDKALEPDGHGLYPIYYAIAAGTVTESWFEPKLYDITKTIKAGYYQGISIAWSLLAYKRFDDFDRFAQGLSPEESYEILKAAPQNSQHINQGTSVAWLLLVHQKYDDFTRLTHGLTPAQSYGILKAAPQNPQNLYGGSVAWRLLFNKRFDDFIRLTQGLSLEQRYEILKAAPQTPKNPQNYSLGISVAWQLLDYKRFDDFIRLAHGFSPEQRYEILKAAPQNPHNPGQGLSVAWRLLFNKRFDDFTCLTQDLTPEQYFEILKSAPLDDNHDFYMQTVFVLLLNNKSYNILLNFTKGLSKEQLKQLLSHPLNKRALDSYNEEQYWHVEQYSTVMKFMMESHLDFAYKLFNPCTYEDLIPWYNSIEDNDIESQFITYLCFSKLHEILHVRFANPPGTLTEEYKEDISKQLKDLFSYCQQILFQPFYYKEVADKLGMLLAQSSETIFRETVIKYLEESGNQDYLHISGLARSYALEGYAHALRIIGNTDTANARALGIIHAQAEKKANELAEENKKLKEEIAALKQRPEITKKEPSISWRTEKKPSFFAEALPVENGKNEQAEQPHDLKGERQLR